MPFLNSDWKWTLILFLFLYIFKLNLAGNSNTTNSLSIVTMWIGTPENEKKTINFSHEIVLFCNGIHRIRHDFLLLLRLKTVFLWVSITEACRFWRDVDVCVCVCVWKSGFLHLIIIAQCKHEHKHRHIYNEYTSKNCIFHMHKFSVCKKKKQHKTCIYTTHNFCIKLCQGESYSRSLVFKRARTHIHTLYNIFTIQALCSMQYILKKYTNINKIHRNENEMNKVANIKYTKVLVCLCDFFIILFGCNLRTVMVLLFMQFRIFSVSVFVCTYVWFLVSISTAT